LDEGKKLMAANTTIYGVQITLDREYTENTAIGLYTVSSLSYLRWSEATLSGVAEGAGKWATGILLKDGIGDIEASSDLSRGGNVAEYNGLTIAVANAESLMQSLKDLQINVTGFSVTVTEFVGTIADSDATSRTTRFTGVVENISWGDTSLTINLKNSYYKRESNLSVVNENGTVTPVCFGNLKPALTEIIDNVETTKTKVDCLAKFVRTLDTYEDTIYTNAYFDSGLTLPLVKLFPIVDLTDSKIEYHIKINGTYAKGTINLSNSDVYMIESGGQIRQVTSLSNSSVYYGGVIASDLIAVYLKDVFLINIIASGDTRTWVQFVKIGRNYNADSMACKDFLKAADGTATDTPELSTYDSEADKYNRIADFGFSVKDTNKNALDIDGSQYSDDIDALDSVLILPITSLARETSATLAQWDNADYEKLADGCYYKTSAGAPDSVADTDLTDASKSYDKDPTTFALFAPSFTHSTIFPYDATVLKFNLPVLPKGLNITSIHFGIKAREYVKYSASYQNRTLELKMRRYAYTKTTDKKTFTSSDSGDPNVDDLPDFYYTTNTPTTNCLNFFNTGTTKGYVTFLLTDCDYNNYNTFIEGALIQKFGPVGAFGFPTIFYNKVYELAIIVKLASSDIKKEVYSPLSARVYGDTWESRKTAADLIEKPVDIIECIKRLQNWSEIPSFTPIDWGHAYSSDALIRTGVAAGSFDSANLNYLTAQKVAMEITDESKATTTAIVKKLCDTFGVCTYDADGYECIETLELTNPVETITLTDQHGAIGDFIEPKIENIFCEPIVNYQWDVGAGKFRQTMKVTHIDAAAWQTSYTPGIKTADGEAIWNSCKALYNKYRQIELCPSEFTDQICIPDYATALAYLQRKIAWMDKPRLPSITVAFSKGKDYTLFKHIMVQLPMYTNNVSVECIIEKIVKSKNNNAVRIDFVIIGALETAWYDTADSTNEYQDTPTPADPAVIDQ
jgi:hypothetical protein